jgi:hypothetical protein
MWNGSFAGPVSVDATESSRDADRSGDIEALRQRRESCRDSRRSPTGTPTRGTAQIPGVVGPAKERIIPLDAQRDASIKRYGSRLHFVEFALYAMGRNFHETIGKQAAEPKLLVGPTHAISLACCNLVAHPVGRPSLI